MVFTFLSLSPRTHPPSITCGASSASKLPDPSASSSAWWQQVTAALFTTKLRRSKLHFVGNRLLHPALLQPSPGEGGRHPGAALALTHLHVAECPLQERAKSRG